LSGSTTAMTPSKYVVVQVVRRSVLPFNCMAQWVQPTRLAKGKKLTCRISSQFGHPFFLNSIGSWMIEHSKQALSCLERAEGGIMAAMVVGVVVVVVREQEGVWDGIDGNYLPLVPPWNAKNKT
jgi:hypothetical protein